MANFEMRITSGKDDSWGKFEADWRAQCDEVEDLYEDYSPDSIGVITGVASGTVAVVSADDNASVATLWETQSGRCYAACVLNRARLPDTQGLTLRVRHLTVSPLLDYGIASVQMYPDVLIGALTGIVDISNREMPAENIRFHLRSPEDTNFFRLIGTSLGSSGVFATVNIHGSWLYITKSAA